jgi:hypothetical protein
MGQPISHSVHSGFNLPPATAARVGVLRLYSEGAAHSFALCAVGVGKNPDSVAEMGRALLSCGKTTPFRIEPQFGQSPENSGQVSEGNKGSDVFQPRDRGSYSVNDAGCCIPHVTGVCRSEHVAGEAVGLAGKACANHVRNSSVLVGRTGLCELTHVSEDGGEVQVSVCDSGSNDALAVFVPLDVSDMSHPQQLGSQQATACASE